MAFYDEMAALALELLAEFGKEVTLVKRSPSGAYNTATSKLAQTPTSSTVRIAYKAQAESPAGGGAVVKRRVEAIISGTDTAGVAVVIDAEDNIVDGARRYKITNPGPVSPAGVVVCYDAVLES